MKLSLVLALGLATRVALSAENPTYCVIDLSAGAAAASYPVTYLDAEPTGGFNTMEYKTTKLVLKRISTGTFIMGKDQKNKSHRVTLTQPFYMGLFEVTQKQWELVMEWNPRPSMFKGEAKPVEQVSYADIRGWDQGSQWPASDAVDEDSFLGRLRTKAGLDFDIPTSAQWEYVCRAGSSTAYWWGGKMDGRSAWYDGNADAQTHEVGMKGSNPWGLYDINGNVWEWCLDWYGSLSYGRDPKGPASGEWREFRGGGWETVAAECNSTYRDQNGPWTQAPDIGFRLVLTLARTDGTPDPDVPELADSYGPFVPGEKVEIKIPGLAGYAAKGLPVGLKLDKKTGTVSGAPTKPTGDAGVTVTFSKRGEATWTAQFIVGPLLNLSVNVIGAGRVSGAGAFAANRKVTLKATADRGFVFAGWYADAACEEPFPTDGTDWRAPSLSHVMPTNDVTVHAKFVPAADDRAALSLAAADECAPKAAIEPIVVDVSGCTSLPTVKVKGLPPGLKFTAKALDVKAMKAAPAAHYAANTVYGTPTRSGVYAATFTVTTAGKRTASTNVTFTVIDRTAGESFLKVACDAEMGKATGAGIYAAGKRVTLKATPQRGFVFAGWCAEDGEPLAGGVDWRTPSFPYVATGADMTVRALFARAEEDAAWLNLICDEAYYTSGAFGLALDVQSLSLPKVALSGLPPGLKFDTKGLRISGTATKPGSYTVTAKLTNATVKKAIAKTFRIVVDNLTGANGLLAVTDAAGVAGSLMNGRGERYVTSVGVAEHGLPVLSAVNAGDRVTLAGLPTGLKYDAKTGKVIGVATKAGTYTVRATVKSGKASYASTFTVEVAPLPSWAVGTFAGAVECQLLQLEYGGPDFNLCGTVTVAANGKLSGRLTYDPGRGQGQLMTAVLSAPSLTGYDAEEACCYCDVKVEIKNGRQVAYSQTRRLYIVPDEYDEAGELIVGRIFDVSPTDEEGEDDESLSLDLSQNVWKVTGFADTPVFAEKRMTLVRRGALGSFDETLTLVLDPKGAVVATVADEGQQFYYKDTTKSNLIVTRHLSDPDCYEAIVPLVFGGGFVAKAKVVMYVSPDGKIHSDDCEVYFSRFWDDL